jgi:hypothetical protein
MQQAPSRNHAMISMDNRSLFLDLRSGLGIAHEPAYQQGASDDARGVLLVEADFRAGLLEPQGYILRRAAKHGHSNA